MKKFFTLFILNFPLVFFAQDPHFTQIYTTPLHLNPSMSGSNGTARIVTTYRNQWNGFCRTINISYDQHIEKIKGGFGLNFLRDVAGEGIFKTIRAGLIYAPLFIVKESVSIRPSLAVDFFQKNIDWSKLTFGDMIDPQKGFVNDTKEVPVKNNKNGIDFSTGILINTHKWNSGLAIHHLTQPDEGLIRPSKLPMKISVHGAYIFSKNDSSNFAFAPSVLLKWQGSFQSHIFNANFKHKKFLWGFGYRTGDAVLLLLGFHSKYFRLGYSFDYTISQLTMATGGSHEFILGILINHKKIPSGFIAGKEVIF